jgi:hypothetical protein
VARGVPTAGGGGDVGVRPRPTGGAPADSSLHPAREQGRSRSSTCGEPGHCNGWRVKPRLNQLKFKRFNSK